MRAICGAAKVLVKIEIMLALCAFRTWKFSKILGYNTNNTLLALLTITITIKIVCQLTYFLYTFL